MTSDPVELAHTLGRRITAAAGKDQQKALGQFMTPTVVARLTAKLLVGHGMAGTVRVLEPAAGAGVLACAVCEALALASVPPARIELTLCELDEAFRPVLAEVIHALSERLATQGIELNASVMIGDFVLANAQTLHRGLFDTSQQFDLAVSNPPYFKVPKDDPRAVACASIVHGQPNIYSFFMAIAAATLTRGGRLAFIVPRSFASGEYFKVFRRVFFAEVRPDALHVFHSRTNAFADDEVLQENVIFVATKVPNWERHRGANELEFVVSASHGLSDLDRPEVFRLPMGEVLDPNSKGKVLCMPSSKEEVEVFQRLRHWTGSLHGYGWDISTGPVVPFRATDVIVSEPGVDTIPLLWMQNVRYMRTSWPVETRKAQYLRNCTDSAPIVLPNKNYVLMRRFSPKEQERRLMVSPLLAGSLPTTQVGLENHLNYIHKPKGDLTTEEIYGLAALLNSRLVDAWFRSTNGNTQVSATELRAMPLPSLDAIRTIGKEVRNVTSLVEIDAVVERLTSLREPEIA